MILLNSGVPIAFAGTEEPAAYGELISIGGLGPDVNGKLSETISEILQIKLSIDSSRFYIKFYDSPVSPILLQANSCVHKKDVTCLQEMKYTRWSSCDDKLYIHFV